MIKNPTLIFVSSSFSLSSSSFGFPCYCKFHCVFPCKFLFFDSISTSWQRSRPSIIFCTRLVVQVWTTTGSIVTCITSSQSWQYENKCHIHPFSETFCTDATNKSQEHIFLRVIVAAHDFDVRKNCALGIFSALIFGRGFVKKRPQIVWCMAHAQGKDE